MGNDAFGNIAQPDQLRMLFGSERFFGMGLVQHLVVLLARAVFYLLGGHHLGKGRWLAHLHPLTALALRLNLQGCAR